MMNDLDNKVTLSGKHFARWDRIVDIVIILSSGAVINNNNAGKGVKFIGLVE